MVEGNLPLIEIVGAGAGATARPLLVAGIEARCPHVIVRNAFGPALVAALLDYVAERRAGFRPATMHSRRTGRDFVEPAIRDCLCLKDLSAFEPLIAASIAGHVPAALQILRLDQADSEVTDFEITTYGDGNHFGAHTDIQRRSRRVRVLSCVYYFAAVPRGFSGGDLRLYGLPLPRAVGEVPSPLSSVDISPETDTLVFFPSWLRHRVLPVSVPSDAWLDRRFTINCWVNRRRPR